MKTLLFSMALFLGMNLMLQAQITTLSGTVSDSLSGNPVENVNLSIIGTNYGTSTDSKGNFNLDFPVLPSKIKVTHIHYKSKIIRVRNWKDIWRIQLVPHIYELSEAVVKPAISISDGLWLDIVDYEHMGDNILLSGYCYHYDKVQNPWIYLISPEGDTLMQKIAGTEGRFFTDCMGNTHYLTNNTDFQIFIEHDSIHFINPERIADFEKYVKPCLFETPQELIFERYETNDQVITYHAVNKETYHWRQLHKVKDDIALNMLAYQHCFFAMGEKPSEADMRFEKMCFYDSIYAPLFSINDSVYQFNFYEDELMIMNENFDIIRTVPVDVHHNKDFQEQLVPDYKRGEIYALFERNGFFYVREISLSDGKAGNTWKIPEFKWIHKITIRDGILYFLYLEKYTGDLVSLYRMKLK